MHSPTPQSSRSAQPHGLGPQTGVAAYHAGQLDLNLGGVYRISNDDFTVVRATPSIGVQSCKIYTSQSPLPAFVTDGLGGPTILTTSHEPWVTVQEVPLGERSQNGFIERVITPDTAAFQDVLGSPLDFAHIIEISTPSQQ